MNWKRIMKYRLEYSKIVRRKLKLLKSYLSEQYGEAVAGTVIKEITDKARELQENPDLETELSLKYEIYRLLGRIGMI